MFKLFYPSNNKRWDNDLEFSSWNEYWKTLGYLSNPNSHKYYEQRGRYLYNNKYDINIKYEYNARTNSYTNTGRLGFFGQYKNELWFKDNFPDLYDIKKSGVGNTLFRINRKEFIETLENELEFIRITDPGANRDEIIIPQEGNRALQLARLNEDFNIEAWNVGWDLGD